MPCKFSESGNDRGKMKTEVGDCRDEIEVFVFPLGKATVPFGLLSRFYGRRFREENRELFF